MPRTVVLEHWLSESEFHFDWLIDRDGVSPLLTFRLPPSPPSPRAGGNASSACQLLSTAAPTTFIAERIADHRRLYLDYEGPISGGRGRVRRLAAGDAEILTQTGEILEIRVAFAGLGERVWKGRRDAARGEVGGESWIFRL